MSDNSLKNDAPQGLVRLNAGNFSEWLHVTEGSLRLGNGTAEVPCGACRGCCRSSMFIHIGPEEKQTMQRIPRALLFPAPGLPKGHVLMGYNDRGECPMLVNGECSIYEDRPQTCRIYDCRVFAATGIAVDRQTQPEIARRVSQWVFNYESEEGHMEHRVVKQAARFLSENRDLFPHGILPNYPVQLAALAIEIYKLFSELTEKRDTCSSNLENGAIALAILAALSEKESARGVARSSPS
jgi:Fe-S-cluster containining protein